MDQSPLENTPCQQVRGSAMHSVGCPSKSFQSLWNIADAYETISWGTAAMSSGAAHNLGSLAASRAFLGLFEAAFGAGAPYFLSMFYKRRELGFRVSLLIGMSALANCFASALAFGITQIRGSLEPWRYLFIIGKFTT